MVAGATAGSRARCRSRSRGQRSRSRGVRSAVWSRGGAIVRQGFRVRGRAGDGRRLGRLGRGRAAGSRCGASRSRSVARYVASRSRSGARCGASRSWSGARVLGSVAGVAVQRSWAAGYRSRCGAGYRSRVRGGGHGVGSWATVSVKRVVFLNENRRVGKEF